MEIKDLTSEQREVLTNLYLNHDEEEGIVIIKADSNYIEYGDQLHDITFTLGGKTWLLSIVFEDGEGRWDWQGNNGAGEGVSLEEVMPKKVKTIKEAIKEVTPVPVTFAVDTGDFEDWCCANYKLDGNEWHEKAWNCKGGICDNFDEGPYAYFSRKEKEGEYKLDAQQMVNDFLDAHPEFDGDLKMIFTN